MYSCTSRFCVISTGLSVVWFLCSFSVASFFFFRERVCRLLVLDSVTFTRQWIRQPKPHDIVHDVCVFVCKCVLGSPRASQHLNIRLCLLWLSHFASCH